jgi:hypothetical protein
MTVERKNTFKKIGHMKIKNYKLERVDNFKYLGVILYEDNNHQIHLQERIKNSNKTFYAINFFFKNKNISKKTKIDTKGHNKRQNVHICIINVDTNKER